MAQWTVFEGWYSATLGFVPLAIIVQYALVMCAYLFVKDSRGGGGGGGGGSEAGY